MAKLISLGIASGPSAATIPVMEIGQVSQPANAPVQGGNATPATAKDMEEIGATGTPIFGGFLRELGEYNAELTWPHAYTVYEQMRRGDAMVAGTLHAIKVRIRSAEWRIHVPEDATDVEKQAAEFAEDCLMDELDFGGVIDNALLMLDFGAAMSEDVYYTTDSQVRLKKIAPRLPLTFYRWLCAPGTDELVTIEQLGYRAGQYIRAELPVTKASLFVFQQEGVNFTGRALLRSMYQPWYLKQGLYAVDAIACERNGMGVPTIILGQDAKTEDRALAMQFVQSLVTHEKTGLVLPHDYVFKLEGVTGTLRDPKDSIAHHNMMIAMAGLAQFMVLGGTGHGGNRALGQTMSDFFDLSLQATADQIGRVISETTIKRLTDFNFSGVKNYPKLVPQQILSVNFQDVVEALKSLAADTVDAIRPDDDLEKWIRQKIGAPKAGEPRLRVAAPVPEPGLEEEGAGGDTDPLDEEQQGQQKQGVGAGSQGPGKTKTAAAGAAEKANAEKAKIAAADLGPTVDSVHVTGPMGVGVKVRRQPRGPEMFLAAAEILSALDKGRDDVAAALRRARPRIQAEVVHKLVDSPVRNMHRVSVAPDEKLTAEITGILEGVRSFGQDQVGQERARQRAGRGPGSAATTRLAAADKSKDPIGLFADGVVSEFQNGLQARATNLALDAQRRGNATKGELITDIGDDLDEQSDKWIDGTAAKGANEAFAEGRQDGYEQHADEIKSVIYSALLDINTCEACANADGREGETPDDVPDVPNPDCDGGDKCRCVQVFVFADEK